MKKFLVIGLLITAIGVITLLDVNVGASIAQDVTPKPLINNY